MTVVTPGGAHVPNSSRFAMLPQLRLLPRGWAKERSTPTSDIYFRSAMNDLVDPDTRWVRFRHDASALPFRQIGPTAFMFHSSDAKCDGLLVLRDVGSRSRNRIDALSIGQTHYVIDDDVAAGAVDPSLSAGYRRRLAFLRDGWHERMMRSADAVHVPSQRLYEIVSRRIGQERTFRIDPCLNGPVSDLAHQEGHSAKTSIIYPNTLSHIGDWVEILPEVRAAFRGRSSLRLTTFGGRSGGGQANLALAGAHEELSSLPWERFKAIYERRFHVALLPGRPTAFNASRSHNKILECARWGAVPIVSTHLPYAHLIERHDAGIVCSRSKGDWTEAIEALCDPILRRRLVGNLVELAARIGDRKVLRQRWRSIFQL